MQGWFWGIHALVAQYNAGGKHLPFNLLHTLRHNRYEGWAYGGGLTLGHSWALDRYWRLEAALGLGYLHLSYDRYDCGHCGQPRGSGHHNYVGPTKLALNVSYVFGRQILPPTATTTRRESGLPPALPAGLHHAAG